MASPCWYLSPLPIAPSWLGRAAQTEADQGSRMFERSEFARDPAVVEQRRLPVAKRRDPDCGSPFFWVLFFGEAKKSASPAGASPGQQAYAKGKSAQAGARPGESPHRGKNKTQ